MLDNVSEHYTTYGNTIESINRLKLLIVDKKISYNDTVIIFFFFLSIDSKMRHWLLCVNQTEDENRIRDKYIKKYVELIPSGSSTVSKNYSNPFMGQLVSFSPLHPHQGIPIMLAISDEDFWEAMFLSGNRQEMDQMFLDIKKLIINT